jgi:Predicted membrane protein
LVVLDLACLAVSLYLRTGLIHAVATAATAVILMLWVNVGTLAPWPATGIVAAGAFALLAFAGLWLARRVGAKPRGFQVAAGLAVVLGQVVAVFAQGQNGSPTLYFLLAAQLIFIFGALGLSWIDAEELGWFGLASVVPAAIAGALWQLYHPAPADWSSQLLYITPVLLAFAAYPLALGRRAGDARTPYLTTVLANVAYFFLARTAIMHGGYGAYVGALPVAQALLLVPVLSQLVRFERERASRAPRGQPYMASDRLALVAAATLACVTVAIPLQLDKNWITIGWALEGAGLLWLVLRIRHAGLFAAGVGLLGVAFVRLTLNPAVLAYHPRGAMPIVNWYLYTYALVAGTMFVAAQLVRGGDETARKISGLFSAAGAVLMFLLLNIEIADFYATGPTITFHFSANLAQDLTYTIGWALFAIALLAAGIVMRSKQSRIASIGLLVVTVLKCFLHDFGRLGGLYRVGSFVGLALSLALVAIVLQRFVLARDEPQLQAA